MFGVSSMIICSLRQGADVFGFLLLSNFDVERLFEIKELMELMSFILSAEVSNHLLMAQLELMSTHDELTHLLNRHAMTRRIEEMTRDGDSVPFGIVSIDLNGLKETNDRYGHDAGDKFIVQAAQLLRKVFSVEGLYRIGGDEFMAIMLGVERSDFNESVGRLRAEAASEDVSLAIGAVFSDGSVDIEEAILQVDELMYADKAAFYEAHPDVRRR
jgi:diguanylate cyclase (GGDEF)-like protein